MNINIKSSIIVLFSVALLTGFISVENTKPIFASPIGGIDLGDLTGQAGDGGGKGPDGPQDDQGPSRDRGQVKEWWDRVDRGNDSPDRDGWNSGGD
ncbi:MAG TPA: hypothetical protein VER14_02870, partial [Phototrophicaceae bacterium]|nr:hypothetical protein [Phototrophicaceae bacterium]